MVGGDQGGETVYSVKDLKDSWISISTVPSVLGETGKPRPVAVGFECVVGVTQYSITPLTA